MIWQKVSLYGEENAAKDKLDNVIAGDILLSSTTGRITEWTADDIQLIGREITGSTRKLLTGANITSVKQAKSVVIGDERYSVERIIDASPRWRVLAIRKWR